MLARRDYTLHEITEKLKQAHYAETDILIITTELVETDRINDLRFVENYLRQRRAKGEGPLRIIMALKDRGISPEMIAEEIKITDNAWVIDAQKTWQKYFKSMPLDFKSKSKQMRFLYYRGFTREQINDIFKNDEELN
jgi:regulatory protein